MKKAIVVLALAAAATLMTGDAQAQPDSNWVRVSATVQGIFDFQINGADYPTSGAPYVHNFGTLSVDGTQVGGTAATSVSVQPDGSSATFRAEPAFGWTVVSAPRRTVDISFQAGVSGGTNTMSDDQLSVQMTVTQQASTGSGATTGYQTYAAATKKLLVNDVYVGNGTNSAAGNVNLQLRVDEDDADGANTFLFELIAESV